MYFYDFYISLLQLHFNLLHFTSDYTLYNLLCDE